MAAQEKLVLLPQLHRTGQMQRHHFQCIGILAYYPARALIALLQSSGTGVCEDLEQLCCLELKVMMQNTQGCITAPLSSHWLSQ